MLNRLGYMMRMKEAGLSESKTRRVPITTIKIYDQKIEDERKGTIPLFRPKKW